MKLISLVIFLILLCYFIFYLSNRPQMKWVVEYSDVPAVNDNLFFFKIDVHYRGYDVGDVRKVQLSDDQKHLDFFVDIYYKNLKIPKNSSLVFKAENIYGTRYIDIDYPKNPSSELLADGDVVQGVSSYERFDQYFTEALTKGEIGKIIRNLSSISTTLNESLNNKNNKKLLNQSATDLAVILASLKEISDDREVKIGIKSAIKYSAGSFKSIDEILSKKETKESFDTAPESISKAINNIEAINRNVQEVSDINKNLLITNSLLSSTNNNVGCINCKVPSIPQALVDNTEKLVVKTNCFESELSKILSKRFLFLKLFFGNPGKSFKNCAKNECNGPKEQSTK